MKLKLFTFRFSETVEGFDDEPMRTFIADKEVIDFSEHFFVHEKMPYITIVFSYRELNPEDTRQRNRRDDPRNELDEKEKNAYDALRNWRAARARQEGIPPYLIANNRQLARIVKLKAATKADLAKVEGIGDAKVERYCEDILKILAVHLAFGPADSAV